MGDKNWVLMSKYDDEQIWDLERYLKSLSPKISVSTSGEKSGVYISNGQTVHSQNTIEHIHFVRIPPDYFDEDIFYVSDVPAFVNTLTEEEKTALLPSMPFLQAYYWCGPSTYITCDPKYAEHIQQIVHTIQYVLMF